MLSPEQKGTQANGQSGRVAIIGIDGRMGSMLSQRLQAAGYEVDGMDLKPGSRITSQSGLARLLTRARIILLCVPVGSLCRCLEDVSNFLSSGHLLMDITSVKALPMAWMEEVFPGAVVGSHPMFGPEPRQEDMKVALVRGSRATEADCAEAAQLFKSFGCEVFWSGADEHDRGVALSQSLTFAVSAAFFAALERHEGIEAYLTPSFKRHLEAARMHLTQDAPMFLEFSGMNPEFPMALKEFRSVFDELAAGNLKSVAAEAARWYKKTLFKK